jgi:hypothetical protein
VKGFLKGYFILPNTRTFVNVVQHLRDFGRFEMNKHHLGRQREDRILVAEEEILHEIENEPRTSKYSASCKSPGSFSVCSLATSYFIITLHILSKIHDETQKYLTIKR